jgi:hypothetical protein
MASVNRLLKDPTRHTARVWNRAFVPAQQVGAFSRTVPAPTLSRRPVAIIGGTRRCWTRCGMETRVPYNPESMTS